MIEIERKFLVKSSIFKKDAIKKIPIMQGYLTSSNVTSTIRVRITGNKAVVTIKSKIQKGSFSRYEWEYDIPLKDAQEMLQLCVSDTINKTRYIIPAGKRFFEVDVFHDANEGLVVAEIELGSEEESFIRPDWLGKEVTGVKRYYNAFIARNPYKTWKK